MSGYELVVEQVRTPVVLVHGGAGNYLAATTPGQRLARGDALEHASRVGFDGLRHGGGCEAVLRAVGEMELDERFNAGRGSRLQRDGRCRVSAALMDGRRQRLSAVYNVLDCLHPGRLADALQERVDRSLDGEGGRRLMEELGVEPTDLRTSSSVSRWQHLSARNEELDPDAAVGDDAGPTASSGRMPPEGRRHGTVGAVACDHAGTLWACTSTGGRGHEQPGRISDSPTPAGTIATPGVALSATGFGEHILELNVGGRVATRVTDGMSLEEALRRTFEEVVAHEGDLGVIAVTSRGELGYAHTTEACGVAWIDGVGSTGRDRHGRDSS